MKLYRLSSGAYANRLDGEGAKLFGGMWNNKGIAIIYTASSRTLAMAEVLVHLRLDQIPDGIKMVELEIPQNIKGAELNQKKLPANWNIPEGFNPQTQKLGDEFCKNLNALYLRVPSAVVKGDFNYVINPMHPDAAKIRISSIDDFPFDRRLFLVKG